MKKINDEKFWIDRVTKTITKNELPKEFWDWICKIRNSPIKLITDVVIGESHKPHIILPSGMKGYLIDYPEAFKLSEENYDCLREHYEAFYGKYSELEGIPALIKGYEDIVFLNDYEYEIISPFFDLDLACCAESIIDNGESDASTT